MNAQAENTATGVLAMMLAWVIPGSGHVLLGRPIRGIIIFVTIGALFWSGMAVGGVLTVDQHNARWWLVAQMLTGVHGVVGFHNQKQVYRALGPFDSQVELDTELQAKGIALANSPSDNIARAYTGIAGMLNLLCMIDALLLGLMGAGAEIKTPPKQNKWKGGPHDPSARWSFNPQKPPTKAQTPASPEATPNRPTAEPAPEDA